MEQEDFKVKGSAKDPYEVTFIKDGDSLTALCTCPAGEFGNVCKHRTSILDGELTGIVSDNAESVTKIVQWLVGSDVEAALVAMREGDNDKDTQAALKRNLARAMNT